MADTILPFSVVNGVSLTGNSTVNIGSLTGPNTDRILSSSGTTGNVVWRNPSHITHLSTSILGGTYYLSPNNYTISSASSSAIPSTSSAYYVSFTIHSTCSVKLALGTVGTAPTVTGTIAAKCYAASRTTGKPAGSSVGDFGTITVTALGNTFFISSSAVTLTPGHYWVGYVGSALVNNLRRGTQDTATGYRINGYDSNGSTTYLSWQESGPTAPPATVGTVSELTTLAQVPMFHLVVQ